MNHFQKLKALIGNRFESIDFKSEHKLLDIVVVHTNKATIDFIHKWNLIFEPSSQRNKHHLIKNKVHETFFSERF